MKKRILTTIIATVVALSMVACGIGSSRELSNDYIIIHQYKGLEIPEMDLFEVTDEDVENRIQMALMEHIEHRNITDRPARDGDQVTIDFLGSVNGVPFEGGAAENHQLHLGSGVFLGPLDGYQGFEEQIVGRNTGESFDIIVKFPEDYSVWAHGMEHLDGQVAVFNINLHAITETVFPELTDEWVQANSARGSTTVEEYRAEIREQLEEGNNIVNVSMLQHRVFEALMEHVEVLGIPQEMLEREVAMKEELYRNLAASEGFEFEDYLELVWQMDFEMFIEVATELAEDAVVRQLVIELIMENENLTLSEEEMYEQIEQIAFLGGMSSATEYLEAFGEEAVRAMINQLRVAEFLIEHAEFVESEDNFDWNAMPEDWSEEWGDPEDWDDWEDLDWMENPED